LHIKTFLDIFIQAVGFFSSGLRPDFCSAILLAERWPKEIRKNMFPWAGIFLLATSTIQRGLCVEKNHYVIDPRWTFCGNDITRIITTDM